MNMYGHSPFVEKMRADLRLFVDERIIPHEAMMRGNDIDALEKLIVQLRAEAQAKGLWGPLRKKEWGGLDLNWRDAQVYLEEASRSPLGPRATTCRTCRRIGIHSPALVRWKESSGCSRIC